MTTVGALQLTRLLRWAMGAAAALTLGLICAFSTLAASPTTPAATTTVAAHVQTASSVTSTASVASMPTMSGCENVCAVGTTTRLCTAGTALLAPSVLALVLAGRRERFLGLLARARRPGPARRRHFRHPTWVLTSPVSLCVLRI